MTLNQVKEFTLLMYTIFILLSLMCNIATVCSIKRQESNLRSFQGCNADPKEFQNNRLRPQRKFVVTLVILTSCFAVTLIPFTLLMFLNQLVKDIELHKTLLNIVKVSYVMNFVVNPSVYFWRMPRYRRSIILLLSFRTQS